jgi:phosphopantothenate--cysteine ligase
MRVLITSGGTKEYIDEVRVLTNISTGKLGATLAERFLVGENDVHYVYTKGSVLPRDMGYLTRNSVILHEVSDVNSLMNVMKGLVLDMDVIIHAMAVSDFGFKPTTEKLKSDDPEAFIESLRGRIFQNPKVLSYIRQWNPKCCLVSFKFEVGKTKDELLKIAHESLVKNDCDLVIANDKAEMVRERSHIAYIQDKYGNVIKCNSKEMIAAELRGIINGTKGVRPIKFIW